MYKWINFKYCLEEFWSCWFVNDFRLNFIGKYYSYLGTIPSALGNLTTLSKIDFGSNSLNGIIRSCLSILKMFTGPIPDIFGNFGITLFKNISLDLNSLTGKYMLNI